MPVRPVLLMLFLLVGAACKKNNAGGQTNPGSDACGLAGVTHNPTAPVIWSPDKTRFLVNRQDANGIFQLYIGTAADTTLTCISLTNPGGLFRSWDKRNKLQVQWDHSGQFIICAVEKEYYNELLYTPYSILLGLIQSGLWMDIWAVTPDGAHWYNLYTTDHGVTGPAFTPNGTQAAWAEALSGSDLSKDIFGKWYLQLANYQVTAGVPSFQTIQNITPAGADWIEPGSFSVDGHSLLVSADIGLTDAEGQDQFILDISNGHIVNLTNSPKVWDEHGVFSPDGKKVLFMSSYPYRDDTTSYHTLTIKTEFMLMNIDGSGLEQLTHFKTPGYTESSPGIAATGVWSADGTTIYAQSLIFPNYDNWIIRFNGACGKE